MFFRRAWTGLRAGAGFRDRAKSRRLAEAAMFPPTSSPAPPSSSPATGRPGSWPRRRNRAPAGSSPALLTEIPGSSNMLERGFVVYSNAAKQELLGVPAETLARHGAVSGETAVAMAEGALRASRAEVAVSVTGIAGPDGGTAAKPVGLVHFACARRGAADGRARGAVRRHRPRGRPARLGQGRARSSGGGARRVGARGALAPIPKSFAVSHESTDAIAFSTPQLPIVEPARSSRCGRRGESSSRRMERRAPPSR